jgi:hypothetical protein
MPKITVKGKGDLGYTPKHGEIREGADYTIEEADFTDALFERPEGWVPPAERPAPDQAESVPDKQPVKAKK